MSRWSLCRGGRSICRGGLYMEVVYIWRWSLCRGGLYVEVVSM